MTWRADILTTTDFAEVTRREVSKHKIPPYGKEHIVLVPEAHSGTTAVDPSTWVAAYIVNYMNDVESTDFEAPFVFKVPRMKAKVAYFTTQMVMSGIRGNLPEKEIPLYRLNWWYRTPANSGSGLYLICFDYPDLINLINDGV
jgi:hypothetical protein